MIDIVPTVMEAAGLQVPTEWDGQSRPALPGKSLVATFTADVPVQRECLWWLHEGNRAVRTGDWKLVAAKNEPWELYDLATDRAEQVNLAARLPDKARELELLWRKYTDQFTVLAAPTATEPQKKSKKK
jgi:arylsulfatase